MLKLFLPLAAVIIIILLDYYLHGQSFTWISHVVFWLAMAFTAGSVVRAIINGIREEKAREAGKEPKV